MMRTVSILALLLIAFTAAGGSVYAQGADDRFPTPFGTPRRDRDAPASLKEMLSKQRIQRDKKDFQELQARGEEALRLSKSLELSFEQNQTVSAQDRDKLVELERVVKKIREELGGDDVDDSDDAEAGSTPNTLTDAFKSLEKATGSLVDELKKASRFTISAAAIQTSNSALKIIRFLRLKK